MPYSKPATPVYGVGTCWSASGVNGPILRRGRVNRVSGAAGSGGHQVRDYARCYYFPGHAAFLRRHVEFTRVFSL